ncbi:MAG: class I SAM-dependent methyltransferase [Mariprofundaceae bacterium]|nr:class I SAM-dependent methyltransferase [Mariprofundaceae bacterium]
MTNSPISLQQQETMHGYVEEVLRFRKVLNLTSISKPDVFERRFITPTLAMMPLMPKQGRLLDIGSGMGVPGIPLMIAFPDLYGVLVERRKKRAEFLRHVIRLFHLQGTVYDADIRHLPCLHIDVFTARAVIKPESLLKMCKPHANALACAVLPVAQNTGFSRHSDWNPVSRIMVDAGEKQQIQRYELRSIKSLCLHPFC